MQTPLRAATGWQFAIISLHAARPALGKDRHRSVFLGFDA